MRKENTKQSFKLHLLALILSLALYWYTINPAPYTALRRPSQPDPPDAKKRDAEPRINHAPPSLRFYSPRPWEASDASPSDKESDEETDDFDWPEFIDG
ncbi:MAG TPA: hypothetical protein VGC66_07815 [Pyrinomonadaceae bacterium]|jgi:hypothetical protein